MKKSMRLFIEASIIASIITVAICWIIQLEGNSVKMVEHEAQSPLLAIDEEMLAATDGHAEIMWVKSLDWQEVITIFFGVLLIYLLIRIGIVWVLSRKSRNHR